MYNLLTETLDNSGFQATKISRKQTMDSGKQIGLILCYFHYMLHDV